MFVLCCKIKIGDVSFSSVNAVRIKRSLYSLAATALIKVPVTAVLKQTGEPPTHIEVAQAVKVGDAVTIELGYNGTYNVEFVGFVKKLNYKVPLEIECEDNYYLLRSINVVFSAKNTTLEQCLSTTLAPLECGSIMDLSLKNYVVNNKPASWMLGNLKKNYGLIAYFDIDGKLNVGQAHEVPGENVKYELRKNVISDDDLKYQLAEDVKLKVKAICHYKNGTQIESEIGEEGGATQVLYFYDVKNEAELKKLASEELKRYSYDGYRGRITAFLQPYALPGMIAELVDKVYEERSGNYYIESTEVNYSKAGGRRTIELGLKA